MAAITVPSRPFCPYRYTLFVSYLGNYYNGSQRLTPRGLPSTQATVQEALESSLEKLFPKQRCKLTSSSRTDKGVHALMNCFTLPLMDFDIPTEVVKRKVNSDLQDKNHHITYVQGYSYPNICKLVVSNNLAPLPSKSRQCYPDSIHFPPEIGSCEPRVHLSTCDS